MGLTLELDHAFHSRSYPGSPRGGDMGLVIPDDEGALVALVDATGHGLGAYAIAQKARTLIQQHADRRPDELLMLLDEGLKGSDGAAALIVRIRGQSLSYAGIGNVAGRVDQQVLHCKLGIVGWRMRRPDVHTLPFPAGSWLLLHTDGVSTPSAVPPGHAHNIVQTLVATRGSDADDASALAVRWQEKV